MVSSFKTCILRIFRTL